jgi:excisionase family DNA binding protein
MSDQRLTYTVAEAGQLLGVSRGSAYQAARAGQLPTVRIGRRLLVPRHALEQLVGADLSCQQRIGGR